MAKQSFTMQLIVLIGLAVISLCISGVSAGACQDEAEPAIDYIFRRADYSGNFTSVKEYWFNRDMDCDLLIESMNKITWYSSDITVSYQNYFKKDETSGCRAESESFTAYPQGQLMEVGDSTLGKYDQGIVCMVKYRLRNKNLNHDLRI